MNATHRPDLNKYQAWSYPRVRENFEIGSNCDTHTSCLFIFFYIILRKVSEAERFNSVPTSHQGKMSAWLSPHSNVINCGSFCSLPSSSSSDKFCNFPSWSRVVIFPSASFYSLSIKMMAPSWHPGLTFTGRVYAVQFNLNPARGGAITADVQGVLVSSWPNSTQLFAEPVRRNTGQGPRRNNRLASLLSWGTRTVKNIWYFSQLLIIWCYELSRPSNVLSAT